MNKEVKLINEVAELLRLRELREEALRRERETCRAKRDAYLEVVRLRKELISMKRDQRMGMWKWVGSDGAAIIPSVSSYVGARKEMFDDEIERNEYALFDDEAALAAAERAFEHAHAEWVHACARTLAVKELLERTRKQRVRAVDQRVERELEPTRMLSLHIQALLFSEEAT